MVNDTQHGGGVHALGGLGQVRVVDQVQVLTGHIFHNLRSGQAELLQHEFGLRGRSTLGGGGDFKATLAVQVSSGDGGNDAVGIGVHVTKNECSHGISPLWEFRCTVTCVSCLTLVTFSTRPGACQAPHKKKPDSFSCKTIFNYLISIYILFL